MGARWAKRRPPYSSTINARLSVTGHLFQARFGSVAMDKERLMAAALCGFEPVRARLVEGAEGWRWSSRRHAWQQASLLTTFISGARHYGFPRFPALQKRTNSVRMAAPMN